MADLAAARERGMKCGNGGQDLTAGARYKGQQAAEIANVRRARAASAKRSVMRSRTRSSLL